MKSNYQRKTDTIIALQESGYHDDFVLKPEYIHCVQHGQSICPDDFEVVAAYRFDHCIIYAIKLLNSDRKGILTIPFRTLTEGLSIHLWSKLATGLVTA